MKKCCFIIPYFGKLPNYFQLFLNSCRYNQDFNWLIFTDDKTFYNYPENVQKVEMTFDECKNLIQGKFDFKICLERPYKLCDIKPMYGYIFSDYLTDFQFWGHCDIDTLMGHLSNFITQKMLDSYDKLFCLGHMILYKNTVENNTLFMRKYKGRFIYKDVLQTPDIYVFDEENKGDININRMFLEFGKKVLVQDFSMNIITFIHRFVRVRYTGIKTPTARFGFHKESFKDALYIWNKNGVFRYFFNSNKILLKEEFLYIHLQERKMLMEDNVDKCDSLVIAPNKFYKLKFGEITKANFSKIRRKGPFIQYVKTTKYYELLMKVYNTMKRL